MDQPAPTDHSIPPVEGQGFRLARHLIRHIRRPRSSPGVGTLALGATALVVLSALASRQVNTQRHLGWIELTNSGPPLVAQVLRESGDEPLADPFTVMAQSTLALPAGEYRLRVHGVGRLGRTYRFAVNSGETQTHPISLDEGRLLGGEPTPQFGRQQNPREEPIPFAPLTAAVELMPGKADLIEWTGQAVIRRDAQTGKPVWDTRGARLPWKGDEKSAEPLRRWLEYGPVPELVTSAPDLDGDGTGDLVWVSRPMSSLLVLSGRNASVIWEHAFELDMAGVTPPDDPRLPGPIQPGRRIASLVDVPSVADVDRDGTPDLVATVVFIELQTEIEQRSPTPPGTEVQFMPGRPARQGLSRRVIQAIGGRTGRTLWNAPIDLAFRTPSYPDWNRPAMIVPGRNPVVVAYVDGEQWIGLDGATGKPHGPPIELGVAPVRPVQYAEFDGDGKPEILTMGPGQAPGQQTLAAFSVGTKKSLWVAPIDFKNDFAIDPNRPFSWPLLVDLDGDGRSEVVVPDSGAMPLAGGYRGVRVVDGQSGNTRWVRPMRPENLGQDGLLQILDAPDLDHDGIRDLITSSFFLGRYLTTNHNGTPPIAERIYIDALSGKDGRPLWWWHRDIATDRSLQLARLRWWGRGPDGWPLLAVPIGQTGGDAPPIVENLEASTGRVATSAIGLSHAGVADLDGDGLGDLWGEADGQLRAFRGETPELWRALGLFGAAGGDSRWGDIIVQPAADFDGDGIADTLFTSLRAPLRTSLDAIASHAMGPFVDLGFSQQSELAAEPPGSRTAVARSGRGGRMIWKTKLDRGRIWYEQDQGESYNLTTQSLPAGDLDGDGAPEVFVQKFDQQPAAVKIKRAATVPLQVLSGRTGRPLWSAGPLPLGFEAYGFSTMHWFLARVVEPQSAPDVFVRHGSPFLAGRAATTLGGGPVNPRLARVSGRDGRILWDIPLSVLPDQNNATNAPPPGFGDLDGDGALDLVLVLMGWAGTGRPDHEIKAISLRDGKLLWSLRLDYKNSFNTIPQLAVADLDGDGRPEVIVTEQPAAGNHESFALKALEGRDGAVRWTWNDGVPESPRNTAYGWLTLADIAGNGSKAVCLRFLNSIGKDRILVFDQRGKVHSSLDLHEYQGGYVGAADVDGDRHDELLAYHNGRLRVLKHDLTEIWSGPMTGGNYVQFVPAPPGHPGTVLVPPVIGLGGADGHRRWAGHSPQNPWWSVFHTRLLDPGDSSRLPRLVTTGLGATVCRSALATAPTGRYAPPEGSPVPPGRAGDDPRWTRPMPWTIVVAPDAIGSVLLAVTALALFNIMLPLLILRLVALRRPWTMRLMMMLPVAAAIPLSAFAIVEPLVPSLPAPYPSSSKTIFFVGSLVGVPLVSLAAGAGMSLIQRRWSRLAVLAGLTVLASLAIGFVWMRMDMRSMPAIERYTWSGWYLVVLPGAYAVGTLLVIAWVVLACTRALGSRTPSGLVRGRCDSAF
jgi:hypothetical protein